MEEQTNDEIIKYLLNKTAEYVQRERLKEAVASYETMVMMLLRENLLLRRQEINKNIVDDMHASSIETAKKGKKSLLTVENG